MLLLENCLLADNSCVISYLIFCRKLGKMLQNLSSAAVVIGALRVNFFLYEAKIKQKCGSRNDQKIFVKNFAEI